MACCSASGIARWLRRFSRLAGAGCSGLAEPDEHAVEGGHEAGQVGVSEIREQEGSELLIAGVHRYGGGLALLRELDQRRPPVGRMRTAPHEPVRLEGVHEAGHIAWGALQRLAELPLRQGTLAAQPPEHLSAGARQPALGQPTLHGLGQHQRQLEQAL